MFVCQRLAALAKSSDLKVCSPTPWFPVLKKNEGVDFAEQWEDLSVYRPAFFYIPRLFKNSDARFYARGLNKWLRDLCQSWQPDILDAHFVWPDGVGVALLARELGIPYTITLRGKLYECLKIPAQTQQCAEALQGAAAVISVSSRMADEATRLGVKRDRLHVIVNGVDLNHFQPRDKSSCRELLGLPQQGRLLVTVAHLGHRKGHHEVIQALADLPDDIRLVIVGGAAQGGTADQLHDIARSNGLENRLILTGAQPYDKIPLYFSAADASVLASYREGCPNAVLESLASGTPVIATDVGAVPDILPASVGKIVPAEQVAPLREAIAEILDQSWDAGTIIRESGVQSWEQVAEKVQNVFAKL
jgi:glycosyltransferase involved in cell wall biosynthesis